MQLNFQILSNEINNGDVKAVRFVMGSSPISGREAFTVYFPSNCSHEANNIKLNKQATLKLFRFLYFCVFFVFI